MVDEVDKIRKEIHKITISEDISGESSFDSPSKSEAPMRLKLHVRACKYDDADEADLFPLPSPSPRSSPRVSPNPSPSASQTNLNATVAVRTSSPLAFCCSQKDKQPEKSTEEILREEIAHSMKAALAFSSSKEEAQPIQIASPKPRRPSFSNIGSSLTKGGRVLANGFSGLGASASV